MSVLLPVFASVSQSLLEPAVPAAAAVAAHSLFLDPLVVKNASVVSSVCASAVTRFVSISELLFPVLSLATPPLLSSSLVFSLSPLSFLVVGSVAVSAAISESAVLSGSVAAAAISVFVVLCLSAALFLLVVLLLLLSVAVSVVLLHFLLDVSLFAVVLLHFLLPVVLRSGAMFGAERSGGLVLIALWGPPPVRRAERS